MEVLKHPLLAVIPKDHYSLLPLAKASFADEEVIYAAGQRIELVYFVLEGLANFIYRDNSRGVKSLVDSVGPGELIGAMFEAEAPVSRFEVVARGEVLCAAASFDDVMALAAASGAFATGLLRQVAEKGALHERKSVETGHRDIARLCPDKELLDHVSSQYILSKRTIPVASQGGTVTVATASPDTDAVEADMRRYFHATRVELIPISSRDFDRAYRDLVQPRLGPVRTEDEMGWYRGVKGKEYNVQYQTTVDVPTESSRKEAELDGRGVVNLTDKILGEALDLESSDVHFEPYPGGMDIRYRIDGELVRRPESVNQAYLNAVLSRLKVLAGMDIAEKRKPQDGRITATCQGKTVDIRVSTVPTRFGEKIVLRILDPSSMLMDLESLVVCHEVLKDVTWMVNQPYGMLVIAGPTGAGKTTTVYSMLLSRRDLPVNIMTIEDPIEYSLRGITQVQRNLHVGLDFPGAVRSFLRQDPDIIVVGETRDAETARAALEAGLTGHLVISTIHANNVFATLYRLREMGMEPFVVANSVMGILAQRLVRRVCVRCAKTYQYHKSLIEPLSLDGIGAPSGDYYLFRKGAGCIACNHKGYKGRAAVFESLRITDQLRPVVASNVPFSKVESQAVAAGAYFSMRRYAAVLLSSGITTPEEISRVLFSKT